MRTRETDAGEIQYVTPVWGDDVDRSGYRFVCGSCGWLSPIMRWVQGAQRHEDEHDCDG